MPWTFKLAAQDQSKSAEQRDDYYHPENYKNLVHEGRSAIIEWAERKAHDSNFNDPDFMPATEVVENLKRGDLWLENSEKGDIVKVFGEFAVREEMRRVLLRYTVGNS